MKNKFRKGTQRKKATVKRPAKTTLDDLKSHMSAEIEGLERRLSQEMDLLKSVVHSLTSNTDAAWSSLKRCSDSLKENTLQLAGHNRRMDEIKSLLADKIDALHMRLDGAGRETAAPKPRRQSPAATQG
jgi:chromosome segregation ATPase